MVNNLKIYILHLSPDVKIIHSLGAHELQLHVRVRVNATWDHQFTSGINDPDSSWDLEVHSDICYLPIFNVDVPKGRAVLVDNFTPFNEDPAGLRHLCRQKRGDADLLCSLVQFVRVVVK